MNGLLRVPGPLCPTCSAPLKAAPPGTPDGSIVVCAHCEGLARKSGSRLIRLSLEERQRLSPEVKKLVVEALKSRKRIQN